MKYKTLCLLFISFAGTAAAQDFNFPKKTESISTGISGTQVMVDQGEVSVSDWFAFIYQVYYNDDSTKLDSSYVEAMPDTTVLPEKYRVLFRFFLRNATADTSSLYYLHYYIKGANSRQQFEMILSKEESKTGNMKLPFDQLTDAGKMFRLLDLPMTGITYGQAQLYLNWRTSLAAADKNVIGTGYNVRARMMTKEEWLQWATNEGPHKESNSTSHIDTTNEKGCYLLNIRMTNPCDVCKIGMEIYGDGAVPVYSFFPDNLGLYNLFGNVWEMTDEKGIAIGGSYEDFGRDCDAAIIKKYELPEAWLGLRCVLEFYK